MKRLKVTDTEVVVRVIYDDASDFSRSFRAGVHVEDALEGNTGRHRGDKRSVRAVSDQINRGPRPRARHRSGR